MTNKEKYDQAFIIGLSIDASLLGSDLEYNSVEEWDSIGHMGLIAELEEAYGISMETDDIIEFSSYAKGIEILKNYKVEL